MKQRHTQHNTTQQSTAQHSTTKQNTVQKWMIYRARRASKWEQKWSREEENQIDREIENTTKNGHNLDETEHESSNHKPINRTRTLRIDKNHIEFLHHKATAYTHTYIRIYLHRYTLNHSQFSEFEWWINYDKVEIHFIQQYFVCSIEIELKHLIKGRLFWICVMHKLVNVVPIYVNVCVRACMHAT